MAERFQEVRFGKTMAEAYAFLCQINADVATTFVCHSADNAREHNKEPLQDFINGFPVSDGIAYGLTLTSPKGIEPKIKSKVTHIKNPGSKKWLLYYVAADMGGNEVAASTTKGETLKLAKKWAEENKDDVVIYMQRRLEDDKNAIVAEIKFNQGRVKEGKFLFFGFSK